MFTPDPLDDVDWTANRLLAYFGVVLPVLGESKLQNYKIHKSFSRGTALIYLARCIKLRFC